MTLSVGSHNGLIVHLQGTGVLVGQDQAGSQHGEPLLGLCALDIGTDRIEFWDNVAENNVPSDGNRF